MTPQSTLVYGPQACGKTRNAKKLMHHFGCTRVLDDVAASGNYPWIKRMATEKPTLFLTNAAPSIDVIVSRHVRVVPFADAMAEIKAAP